MAVRRIVAAFFSPTGNTEQLAKAIAGALTDASGLPVEFLDFTQPEARGREYVFTSDDLLVIGLPVYAGRLPNKILPFIQENLKGAGTLSLPFVCYGNRAFDDGLSELVYEQKNTGFRPVAAAAFATQHAFASALAHGRPDEADLEEARAFARDVWPIIGRADRAAAAEAPGELSVEGSTPPGPYYRPKRLDGEPAVFLKAKPSVDTGRCTGCGTCARVCAMGSIDPSDVTGVPGICIKCQACVTRCPQGARYFDDPDFLSHKEMLEANFTEAKPNRFWFAETAAGR